ncbi:sodium:solute symporter family protein [Sulfobacillus harzensis]|uniref:Sodium:solute symporter n=1 Tax=Sulfobacillus harzensis TaxID=2729629 RepID=A0A7Y0L539_9FIRM|nr:hypothetical protein [Sulfobacillus harzensis]NMP23436.1 hypothetical protein [Sulfobacillus harzensis]
MAIIMAFLVYTLVLMWLGHRPRQNEQTFRTGGHGLSPQAIFYMVTALWSSSLIVVQIDTAYASGLSAVWYGVSVAVMSILVSLLIPWFRSHQYISNSALLGRIFGSAIQRFSGLVIGATFPIFALSNALAAGAFLHVATHWPLWMSMALTTFALILYIQFAGMISLARTQGLNFFVVLLGVALATFKLGHIHTGHLAPLSSSFWQWGGIGHGLIWVWFGMNTLNVFAAQAEIQAVAAAHDIRQAQRAVWLSTGLLLAVIAVSTWLGIQTRLLVGNPHIDGLVAFAKVVTRHSPAWFVALTGLGIWALALTWCGPLLFSGATSLGGDVIAREGVVRWTRIALVVEGILMVLYGIWRPSEIAWWRVFGLTLRNAAVVGPTMAGFLWEDLPPRAVLSAMISGVLVGLGLNAWTGFSATHFVWGINPMWSAATVSLVVLSVWRLAQHRRWTTLILGILAYGLLTVGAIGAMPSRQDGLLGLAVLTWGLVLMGLAWISTRSENRTNGDGQAWVRATETLD